MSTQVKVRSLPNCDICGDQAKYDGKTCLGPWAYMCPSCFLLDGIGLGLGIGQELILEGDNAKQSDIRGT